MPTPKNAINLMGYMFSGETKVSKTNADITRKYNSHVERVKTMKPYVDDKLPKTFNAGKSNITSKMAKERQDKVDRDNILLVMKLQEIMTRKPITIIERAPRKTNPYEEVRERKYREIEQQNFKLVKRLVDISKKSEYDRKKQLESGAKNQEHVRRLCRYNSPKETPQKKY